MNAAEPVSPDTHRRFFEAFAPYGLRDDAYMAAYGLAENTLCVTQGGRRTLRLDREAPEVVSCGAPIDGVEVRVVAPDTSLPLGDRQVGEIWVAGSSACRGYWANSDLTAETFHNVSAARSEVKFIRTGDLGFFDRGELFVCGRINDVIIRRGRNYHPHDIERTVEAASPKVRFGAVAAIGGREEGSLVVIAEARRIGDPPDPVDLAQAIATTNGIVPDRVVVAGPGAIEKTTSGKMARAVTRRKCAGRRNQRPRGLGSIAGLACGRGHIRTKHGTARAHRTDARLLQVVGWRRPRARGRGARLADAGDVDLRSRTTPDRGNWTSRSRKPTSRSRRLEAEAARSMAASFRPVRSLDCATSSRSASRRRTRCGRPSRRWPPACERRTTSRFAPACGATHASARGNRPRSRPASIVTRRSC